MGLGPRLMKKNLPGRGLTKVEKHCCISLNWIFSMWQCMCVFNIILIVTA